MKWLLVLVVANLARIGAGGALRCQAGGSEDTTTCSEDMTELAVPTRPTEPAALPSGVECAAGSTWRSQCNQCTCSPTGYAYCTQMACLGKLEEPMFRCAPETRWKLDCNTCWCTSQGQPACTLMGCVSITGPFNPFEVPSAENKEDEPGGVDHIERHSVCKAAATFYIGCNTCHCNYFGNDYSCTNKPCPLPQDVELFHELKAVKKSSTSSNATQKVVCVANRMFIMDCNTCWCNEDGTSFFCTRKVCAIEEDGKKKLNIVEATKNSSENTTTEIVCLANGVFHIDCNKCWCNNDGTDYICTRKGCMPEAFEESSRKANLEQDLRIIKKECTPDEVFEIDCNMCRCNPDGLSYSCTRRACVSQMDEEERKNNSQIRKTRGVTQEPRKTCEAGKSFRMDCNTCLCDNEGQDFSCTRNDCNAVNGNGPSPAFREKRESRTELIPMECVTDSVFDRDCNVCRCTDGKHAMCTTKRCTPPQKDKEEDVTPQSRTELIPMECVTDSVFDRDCNVCVCTDGKHAMCTTKRCTPPQKEKEEDVTPQSRTELIPMECVTDSVFDRDCNVCVCTDGKHARCTTKRCTPPQKDKEEDVTPLPNLNPDFRCNPGEQFKRGCNDCSCSADGKSVFCTVRFCDQDIAPVPST